MTEATPGAVALMARQAMRDARVRTAAFAYLFLVYGYVQVRGYRGTYPTRADRLSFAAGFGDNAGLRLLYGRPYDLLSVGGYVAWRVGGVLAVAAAAYGVLAAVRSLRAEEESGRAELVLALPVTRRDRDLAAGLAVCAGLVLLWLAEFGGLYAADAGGAGDAALLALAGSLTATVFAGWGAVTSQLAATRRGATGLGLLGVAAAFLLRVLADTVTGMGWLGWVTPLGWAERVRPFAGARPAVLVLPLVATGALVLLAGRLAAGRDVGTSVLPARDTAPPRRELLGSPTAFALRTQWGAITAWLLSVAAIAFVLGIVSDSISSADVPADVRRQLAKFGAGSILTPLGYLGFVFVFVVVALSAYACSQAAAARREEEGQLETVLAQPVTRTRWLAGRLTIAILALAAVALTAGLAAWSGARAAGVHVALPRLVEAGANALPAAVLFLGVATLAVALVPRAGAAIAYGLLTATFIWQLVGTLLGPPRWLLDLTPFAHVAPVPAKPFDAVAAGVLVVVGVVSGALGITAFRRRDLRGG